MAYPIKFKLQRKGTGESFNEWARSSRKSDAKGGQPVGLMPYINQDGNVGFVDFEGYYLGNEFFSPKDWELYVALEKDDKGQWVYKKVGY